MKKILAALCLLPLMGLGQNYMAIADSCEKVKNFACAAAAYDQALLLDSSSNGIAFMALESWARTGNKDSAFRALNIYVRNNALNDWYFFSKQLEDDSNLNSMKNDVRWERVIAPVKKQEDSINAVEDRKIDSTLAIERGLEKNKLSDVVRADPSRDAKTLYHQIKNYNHFPSITEPYISLQFRINDSLTMAFLVVLPKDYDAHKSYPLLFFLHGAVNMNGGYMKIVDARDTGGWNRYYTKYADNMIMVYPHANKDYNWMYPDKGFYMLPAILKQIKQIINVDDNRVFISGHSNGATGSFSYLMKEPSPFAAFYGFNTQPRVATGGTFLRNILNRSYFNVSTDQDYYYPPGANDTLAAVMKSIHADYQDHRYNGFPHWFPQFDESEPAVRLLLNDLNRRERNPFHPDIYWQCDDVKHGGCDWIQITALDTNTERASWMTDINFTIHKWIILGEKNKAVERDTLLNAFRFRRKSGAVKAHYSQNEFTIETSDVKTLQVLISPEMVDLSKPVTIILNGKVYFSGKLPYDRAFMVSGFENSLDRKAIWVNKVEVELR